VVLTSAVHPISLGDPEAGDQGHGEQQDPDSQTHPGIHLQGQQDMGYGGLPPVADQVSAALLKLGMIFLCSHLYTPFAALARVQGETGVCLLDRPTGVQYCSGCRETLFHN